MHGSVTALYRSNPESPSNRAVQTGCRGPVCLSVCPQPVGLAAITKVDTFLLKKTANCLQGSHATDVASGSCLSPWPQAA